MEKIFSTNVSLSSLSLRYYIIGENKSINRIIEIPIVEFFAAIYFTFSLNYVLYGIG